MVSGVIQKAVVARVLAFVVQLLKPRDVAAFPRPAPQEDSAAFMGISGFAMLSDLLQVRGGDVQAHSPSSRTARRTPGAIGKDRHDHALLERFRHPARRQGGGAGGNPHQQALFPGHSRRTIRCVSSVEISRLSSASVGS